MGEAGNEEAECPPPAAKSVREDVPGEATGRFELHIRGGVMIIEALIIGLCIIVGAGMVGIPLSEIGDTLQKILKRWAALENLGIFPPHLENEEGIYLQPTGSHKTDPFVGK